MTRTTSVYLDVIRVSAALSVMLFHASFSLVGGTWLQPVAGDIGSDAVIVFFVLSGFVISYTANEREKTPKEFFVNRFARLWSVAIPALILTVALDTVGRTINPNLYSEAWSPTSNVLGRLVSSGLFV